MPIGQVTKPVVSAISVLMDHRDIFNKLVNPNNDARFFDIAFMTNRLVKTEAAWFDSALSDRLIQPLDTTGATKSGDGQPGTFLVITGIPVLASGFAQVSDILDFPDGAQGVIRNVTTAAGKDTLTVQSVNTLPLNFTIGDKLGTGENMQSEGSTGPKPLRRGMTFIRNVTQIQRWAISQTDVQKSSKTELDFGNGDHRIFVHEEGNMVLRAMAGLGKQFWAGQPGGTLFSTPNPVLAGVNGLAEQKSRGAYNYITTGGGVNDQVAVAGTVTNDDMTDFFAKLDANKSPRNGSLFGARLAISPLNSFLKGLGSSGVTSGRLMVDGKELNFDTEEFTWDGFNMKMMEQPVLANVDGLGYNINANVKSNIANSLYYFPEGNAPTSDGGTAPYWQIRYMEANPGMSPGEGLPAIFNRFETGALASTGATNTVMEQRIDMVANCGPQFLLPQHFGILKTK